MTVADIMRHAAAKMREQANAVDALGQLTELIAETECDEFADFIASWDPIVARAVADWLDDAANDEENTEAVYANVYRTERPQWARETPALAVAKAFLDVN